MSRLRKIPLLTAALIVCAIGLLVLVVLGRHQKKLDARLATPAPLLLELLKSGSPVFITPDFLPCITALPTAQKALLPSPRDAELSATDKSAFWQLNREHHFSSVLVGASPAWRPLIDSLLFSPLWVLTDVSPWGYLFKPQSVVSGKWQPPSEKGLEESWPHTTDRARFMILTAANLAAINRLPEAEQMLNLAETTHEFPSLILSTRASIAASRGQWDAAASLAQKSLHTDGTNRAAGEILIRSLIESRHADEALDKARELVAHDEDTESLFLLARAANAANSSKEEIDALSRLVALARTRKQPLGASLTYLGQAYARSGDRGEALRTFQQAVLSPELTGEQRKMIREIMDHLMQGNIPSSTLPALPSSDSSTP